jgi:hypothetical protein
MEFTSDAAIPEPLGAWPIGGLVAALRRAAPRRPADRLATEPADG